MASVVQARLTTEEQKILSDVVRRLGWSPSRIVREGIRLVASSHPAPGRHRIIGTGEFDSGIGDLASNKKHLKGFGR